MRLDRLDAQEELLGDRAVALAGGGQLADLALARRQRRGALDRGLARAQPGRRELAARALRQQHGADGVGVGQRRAQRSAGFDAPADVGQRAAQLEPQAHALQHRRHALDHGQPALAQRDARGVVGLRDGARVQRVGDRHRRAEALGERHLGVGQRGRLLAAPEVGERQRGGRAPRRPARVVPSLLLAQRARLAGLGVGALEVALGQPQARSRVRGCRSPSASAPARRRGGGGAAARGPRSNSPRSASA